MTEYVIEDFTGKGLEDRSGVGKSMQHHNLFKKVQGGGQSHLPLISFPDTYKIVCISEVQLFGNGSTIAGCKVKGLRYLSVTLVQRQISPSLFSIKKNPTEADESFALNKNSMAQSPGICRGNSVPLVLINTNTGSL